MLLVKTWSFCSLREKKGAGALAMHYVITYSQCKLNACKTDTVCNTAMLYLVIAFKPSRSRLEPQNLVHKKSENGSKLPSFSIHRLEPCSGRPNLGAMCTCSSSHVIVERSTMQLQRSQSRTRTRFCCPYQNFVQPDCGSVVNMEDMLSSHYPGTA